LAIPHRQSGDVPAHLTYRIADGLIQEDWEHWDGKGFDLQLGLLSRPARADLPSAGTGE
jgi:hypothetical protein